MEKPSVRIAVLGSTRGTDLEGVLEAQQAGQLSGAQVVVVISNVPAAYILTRAEQHHIPAVTVPSQGQTRVEFEQAVLTVLKQYQIDLIILIGFMRILSADFIQHYPQRIMNIHPSLLPKYAGGMNLDVHAEVLKQHDTETGCTLHYVTPTVDAGPIILQERVPVLANDTSETLKQRVQAAEQVALVKGIKKFTEQFAEN